jgi:DNA-binding response OmpR family regulator
LALDADDFVYKPVSRPILRARVEAVLRRFRKAPLEGGVLALPPYALDQRGHHLCILGEPVVLKAREFDLAWMLFSNPNRFMAKAELLAGVWGTVTEAHSHSLAQHVSVLRRKLDLATHGFRLSSVYGAGYRFDPPAPPAGAV